MEVVDLFRRNAIRRHVVCGSAICGFGKCGHGLRSMTITIAIGRLEVDGSICRDPARLEISRQQRLNAEPLFGTTHPKCSADLQKGFAAV